MYPHLFSLNNQVDVPSTWSEPQRMYPPLCSLLQPRSYPLLTQNSQTVSSLNSVFGQRILRRLVLWILCLRNQKNSQMVSSLNSFGKREKERRRRKKNRRITQFLFLQNFPFFKERLNKNLEWIWQRFCKRKAVENFV